MVYHEILSRDSLLLYERLTVQNFQLLPRDLCLNYCNNNDTISLLQVCKQISSEARPLLHRCNTSRLVISKDIEGLWTKWDPVRLQQINFPFNYITRLDFDVGCLGHHRSILRHCPRSYPYLRQNCITWHTGMAVSATATNPRSRRGLSADDLQYNADVKRFPILDGIHSFIPILTSLPALRELHISNVLKSFLEGPNDLCACSIAGTESCSCGQCQCHCPDRLALPFHHTQTMLETQTALWSLLHTYFQCALPVVPVMWPNRVITKSVHCSQFFSDYDGILDPLAHGVHIFLHETFALKFSLERKAKTMDKEHGRKVLHKGTWCAVFHLMPPQSAFAPVEPPSVPPESARQRKIRVEKEKHQQQASTDSEQIHEKPAKSRSTTTVMLQSGSSKFRVRSKIDGRPLVRSLPGDVDGRQLSEFESDLKVTIMDEEKFDSIIETGPVRSDTRNNGEKFGKLRD